MKKRYIILAISLSLAVGLYVGVNTDFKKINFFKMIDEIESCVEQGLSVKEEALLEEEGIYQVKDFLNPSEKGTVICKNDICLPPSKREG